MRSQCALYIDVGYLMAAMSTRMASTSLRSAADVDVAALLRELTEQLEVDCGLPLLRINWYDAGTRGGTVDAAQRDIASLPKVKLRLGRTGINGEQKGVDLKLALDMTTQARNHVAEVVYLMSGDDDLSEAVEEAQQVGVQVIGLAVPDVTGRAMAFSNHLRMVLDDVRLLDEQIIVRHVRAARRAVTPAVPVPVPDMPREAPSEPPAPVSSAGPALTTKVTPASIAGIVRPQTALPPEVPRTPSRVAYSGLTAGPVYVDPSYIAEADGTEATETVARNVVASWWTTASTDAQVALKADRPSVPPEIDRTLLRDLSAKLDVFDIPTHWRYRLREAFWREVDQLT